MAVAASGGGADRDEHGIGVAHGRAEVVSEGQAAGGDVAADEGVQSGFVDGDAPVMEGRELFWVPLYDGDVRSELGEAGARDETDISATDHCNTHTWTLSFTVRCA
ncbi:hypothetical protein GCM10007866_10530 [Gluconobacter albidus]|uniref:Uncharacterized protein n=1 Tax=Gluconobacter albidus TaxID=318683 RepID=A0ABQ5X161_9PROT|nr:hypothetical protein AA3250_0859 [Gluconobacter albidus NBRC 3250]GLQ68602.1 hypothetical protein GCM10007866_10530 [Gluconobacter albidus]